MFHLISCETFVNNLCLIQVVVLKFWSMIWDETPCILIYIHESLYKFYLYFNPSKNLVYRSFALYSASCCIDLEKCSPCGIQVKSPSFDIVMFIGIFSHFMDRNLFTRMNDRLLSSDLAPCLQNYKTCIERSAKCISEGLVSLFWYPFG